MFSQLSSTLGIPYDQAKTVITFFFCILLNYFIKYLKNPTIRLLYFLVLGLTAEWLLYGNRIIDALITDISVLMILKFAPRKYSGIVANLFTFAHLFYLHIERLYTDYGGWSMDISLLYMTLVPKWSAYAYNYQDGAYIEGKTSVEIITQKETISKDKRDQLTLSVKNIDLLCFMSYIHGLPTCLIGPFNEYDDYINFINLKENYSDIYISPKVIIKKILVFILSITLYSLSQPFTTIKNFTSKYDNLIVLREKNTDTLIDYAKVISSYLIICFFFKLKYYAGFTLSEMCCDVSGLSYSQKHRMTDENNCRILHTRPIECETTWSIRKFFKVWNISIHNWLKNYCFKRVVSTVGTTNATLITFSYSCIWHGFYLSYYIIFSSFMIAQFCQDYIYMMQEYINNINNLLFRVISFILFNGIYYTSFWISFCFLGICLELLKWSDLIEFLVKFKFFPVYTISIIILLGIFSKIYLGKTIKKSKNTPINY
jgi:lysophospholipid acyltransferase